MTSKWSPEKLRNITLNANNTLPLLNSQQHVSTLPGLYLWDVWPIKSSRGVIAKTRDTELWLALSAPADLPADTRHHVARIRLLGLQQDRWLDCGLLFGSSDSFADHEWTGSAVLDEQGRLTLFYTAVGERGDSSPSYRQRIVQTNGRLSWRDNKPEFVDWSEHCECVEADGVWYARADQKHGRPGFVRAFRDPYRFLDPASNSECLVLTTSMGQSASQYCGAVGLARSGQASHTRWQLQAPIFTAEGVNTELERAHIIYHNELYYLFWSTQAETFHPDCAGPDGLYGAVAERLEGPYKLLNGSGLVVANPPQSPSQSYAWEVLQDLSVISHVHNARASGSAEFEFVGAIAPRFDINLDGSAAHLAY